MLGNLYTNRLQDMLAPRLCTNATCGCHIGYVHMDHLNLYEEFGEHVLERIWSAFAENRTGRLGL